MSPIPLWEEVSVGHGSQTINYITGTKKWKANSSSHKITKMALLLAAYQYDIKYRSTEKHGNADYLSRLPIGSEGSSEGADGVKLINTLQIESLPMNVDQVRKATQKDPILSRVLQFVMTGWPDKQNEPETTHYFTKRHEITVEDGCLLWGIYVIIPKQLREWVLHELHTGHPGIVRMKSLARLHVWRPNLDKDITMIVQQCSDCQVTKQAPTGTFAPMGLAEDAMAESSHRFRWAIDGKNVPDRCR